MSTLQDNPDRQAPAVPPAATLTDAEVPRGANLLNQVVPPPAPIGSGFNEETRVLLRRRLLLCHTVAAVFTLGLLLADWGGAEEGTAFGQSRFLGAGLRGLLFLHATVGAVCLWRLPGLSIGALRTVELAFVATSMLVLGALRVDAFLAFAPESLDPRFARVVVDRVGLLSNLSFYFAILYYGALIPNTRRRSLWVVSGMSVVPLLATGLAAALNPAFREFAAPILVLTSVGLVLAGVAAVFSAARINTLQRQAFEARHQAQQVGPYLLQRLLGKGGMGAVYLAQHNLLKRPCAVKLIHPELSSDPRIVARFNREVQSVTGLSHLHTVRVYDYGQAEDGTLYYVMEYLDGLTLEALVRRDGPLVPGRAVYLLRQVCGALAEAHAAGLIHRDLKPGNLLIAELGGQKDVAKLLDFGLVWDLGALADEGRLTRTGVVMGTPAYMCPEQAGGESAVDARWDIYSLGAVAFFAVTGRTPFEAKTIGKMLTAHLTQPAPRTDEVRPEVPADLADVIARCLAKAPDERFQSMAELEAALAGCACAAQWSSVAR
jgi:serine/threonine-protein kinase